MHLPVHLVAEERCSAEVLALLFLGLSGMSLRYRRPHAAALTVSNS